MANGKELLSDELLEQVEAAARAQHREPADVLQDAVKQYLERESWVEFVERNERRARKMGIKEEDVPRLVEQVRRENQERGR